MLDPIQKATIVKHYLAGWKYQRIADDLGVPYKTISYFMNKWKKARGSAPSVPNISAKTVYGQLIARINDMPMDPNLIREHVLFLLRQEIEKIRNNDSRIPKGYLDLYHNIGLQIESKEERTGGRTVTILKKGDDDEVTFL